MGCGISTAARVQDWTTVDSQSGWPSDFKSVETVEITNTSTAEEKQQALELIKKNSPFNISKLYSLVKVQENLLAPGDKYTCLHAAAEFNADAFMRSFISWLSVHQSQYLELYLNVPDVQGRTPLLLSVIHNALDCFEPLIQTRKIDTNVKTKEGKSIQELVAEKGGRWIELVNMFAKKCEQIPEDHANEDDDFVDDENMDMPKGKPSKSGLDKGVCTIIEVIPRKKKLIEKVIEDGPEELRGMIPSLRIYGLLRDLIQGGRDYIDPDFKHELGSITKNHSHRLINEFKKAVWKRPSEILESDFSQIKLFDSVNPNDISQGLLGVCYFLSSIAAIAEYPERLSKILYNKVANKHGAYAVKFYVQGIPREVIVDDWVPYLTEAKIPMFSKPKGKEIWVLLLEKAWAKLYGSYTITEAGKCGQALEYLLGIPTIEYPVKKQSTDEIWQRISAADQKKWIITAGTSEDASRDVGLVAGHAYSVIGAYKVNGFRVLKMRNPWGNFEWKGMFSDNSWFWTESAKKTVGYVKADDGVFFMTIKDFKKYFVSYTIGCYTDGWRYTAITGTNPANHGSYFTFKIEKNTEAFFSVHQADERFHVKDGEKDTKKYNYSSVSFRVCKIETGGLLSDTLSNPDDADPYAYIGASTVGNAKDRRPIKLTPGNYLVRVKAKWFDKNPRKYTLSTYASNKIVFERVKSDIDFYKAYYLYYGLMATEKKEFGNGCFFTNKILGEHQFIHVENKGNQRLTFVMEFSNMTNMRLAKYCRVNDKEIKMELMPGERAVAVAKRIDPMKPFGSRWKVKPTFHKLKLFG